MMRRRVDLILPVDKWEIEWGDIYIYIWGGKVGERSVIMGSV